jgi:hypothetical protein
VWVLRFAPGRLLLGLLLIGLSVYIFDQLFALAWRLTPGA